MYLLAIALQEEFITIPKREYEPLKALVVQLSQRVSYLEEQLRIKNTKKNSSNSGIAPQRMKIGIEVFGNQNAESLVVKKVVKERL